MSHDTALAQPASFKSESDGVAVVAMTWADAVEPTLVIRDE